MLQEIHDNVLCIAPIYLHICSMKQGLAFILKDAEKVAENSRKNRVQFGNKAISISLCYYNPSAAKDEHEKKGLQSYSGRTKELRQTCRHFDFLSEAECDVIQFIQKSQTDMEAMTKEFENLANVKFQPKRLTGRNCPSQYIIRFQPLPVKYRTNGQQINQKSFESECKSKIMAFLEKYTVRVGKFDPRDLDNICKSNSWRNQSDITLIEIDQRRSVSVFARWNHPKDGDFTIAGQETEVSQAFKWLKALEEKEKKTEMFEIIKEWQLDKSLQEVFSVVNKQLKCSSLALPAIGTGNRGFTSTGVAKATRDALHDFSKTKPSHLQRIEIVVFQNSMLSDFQSIISRNSKGSSVDQKREPEKRESIFPKEGVGQKGESIKLLFCAAHKININNAWQRVKEHIHDKSATKVLEDEVVAYLDHVAEKKLIDIGEKYNVHLRKTSEASGKDKIIISGIKDNVFDAHVAASDIVREYAEIIAIAEYVIWQYYDLQSHTFVDFSQRDSWKTELAHKKNDKGGTTLALKVGSQKRTFDLDFTNMEESCRESRSKTKIRRRLASQESDDLPETWTDMGGRPWKLETLPQQSTEYQTVLKKYANKGLNISHQCQIQRIQNPTLYKQFIAQKKKIGDRMKADKISNPVTRELFHGTSADACPKIYKDGFDRSYAGLAHDAWYGKGVYFATTSRTSNGYAKPDVNGKKRMFLAEVITGEYCQGQSSMATAPFKTQTQAYDSVVC
ncbi:unnamed protein product [Clavelina lepadiformis]|uniref:Poly [ADP-ribose] polymerase n=1 Tax=Clavelina lepadiformis TaxID=159417 RepID=A0ABP0H2B4_CLALP